MGWVFIRPADGFDLLGKMRAPKSCGQHLETFTPAGGEFCAVRCPTQKCIAGVGAFRSLLGNKVLLGSVDFFGYSVRMVLLCSCQHLGTHHFCEFCIAKLLEISRLHEYDGMVCFAKPDTKEREQ